MNYTAINLTEVKSCFLHLGHELNPSLDLMGMFYAL